MSILDKCIISSSWRYHHLDTKQVSGQATWELKDVGTFTVDVASPKDKYEIEKLMYHSYYTGLKEGLKQGALLMTEQLQEVENNECSQAP